MAVESIALASSLASLLEISGRIVSAGYGYISKVTHAPSHMRVVLSEVSSVNLVLGRLEEYSANHSESGSSGILDTLFRNGVFEDCRKILNKIDGTVQVCMAKSEASSSKHEVKAFMKRIVWPMREKETEEVLGHLDRLRSVLSDAIAQDSAASVHRMEKITQQLHQNTINLASTQRHTELMAWVCPYDCDPFTNYQEALKRRQTGTGRWLLDSESFKSWSQNDNGMFWLRGLPGCGKSVLISTVVEHVHGSLASLENGVSLAYFYIDYRDPAKQSIDACLASLVRQLLDQNTHGIRQLERLREQKQRNLSHNLTTSEYICLLRDLASLQTRVYLVIDALDEAQNPVAFFEALDQLSGRGSRTPIAMLVSSRNDPSLESILLPIVSNHVLVSDANNDDVRVYVTTEVNLRFSSGKLKVPDIELIDLTIVTLVARSDGLFLQASLLLDFVFAGKTSRSIRKALTELPNGLEETYRAILRRITARNQRHISEIKRCLQWLSRSFIPLTPAMLVEAAAIEPDDTFLDPEALMDQADLIGMLSSLVLVNWRQTPPIVGLAHQTVKEYLQSQNILQSDMSEYYIDPCDTDHYLAETSIQYLLFPGSAKSLMQVAQEQSPEIPLYNSHHDPFGTASMFERAHGSPPRELLGWHTLHNSILPQQHNKLHYCLPPGREAITQIGLCRTNALQDQELLKYAANLWPEHLKRGAYTPREFHENIAPRLQWYLYPAHDGGEVYKSWEAFQRWRLSSSLYFVESSGISDQSPPFRQLLKSSYFTYIGHETTQNPFFYTILFGLDDCFDLLRQQYDVDMTFHGGWTPLTVAAASGSFSIAKRLLEVGADVNKAADMDERNGLTPLHIAAELAMEDLVVLFLEHGASISSLTGTLTTPFYRAARGGSLKILTMLHDAGSDVNGPTWDHWTPLMEAVNWSYYDVLRLLLSWGANPYLQNSNGESAIDQAYDNRDEAAVKILKEAGSRYLRKSVDTPTLCYRDAMR